MSVSGNTITITDRDGFHRTIHTTADTEYGDGVSASPAADTRIFAIGTVDTDKVSLLATRIEVAPERPAPGERGDHRHPGGPGGAPGDRPEPGEGEPSGPATPSPSPSPTG